MIDQILTNEYFLLALTFGIYQGAKMLQRRTGSILLNPILIAIGLMIAFLTACDIPYDTYHKSGQMIEFWLKPAVVALECHSICSCRRSRSRYCRYWLHR